MRHRLVTGLVALFLLVSSASRGAEEASPAATFAPGEAETLAAMHDQAIALYEEGDYAGPRHSRN